MTDVTPLTVGAPDFLIQPRLTLPSPVILDESPLIVERTQTGSSSRDQLVGDRRSDGIDGGGGDDALSGKGGIDLLSGDSGNDTLNGGAGGDRLLGGSGNDQLNGGAGNDTLIGGGGRDTLVGGGGNDILDGGSEGDSLTGGIGHDTFLLNGTSGQDTVRDFVVGEDRIGLPTGIAFSDLTLDICNCGTRTLITYQGNIISVILNVVPSQLSEADFVEVVRAQ